MNTALILHLCIVLHIIGIALMAGTNVADMVTFRAFRLRLERDDPAAAVLLEHLSTLGVLLGIGAALLILSGTGLLILTKGLFIHMGWFQCKLTLVALLILNGFGFGGRQMARVIKLMKTDASTVDRRGALKSVIPKIRLFYGIQLLIYLIIIGLSVSNV